MVSSFIICGSGSLTGEEEEEKERHHERATRSAGSTPRRSSSSSSTWRTHNHKNPYANRGLDKFSALLAEIEEERQRIYSENNPDEICFVQFDYSKNNNCKPIVIRVKPNKEEKKQKHHDQKQKQKALGPQDQSRAADQPMVGERSRGDVGPTTVADEKSLLRSLKLHRLRKPRYYLPAIVILILIFLALFGRSVAILCTSIGWYVIPTISNRNSNSRRSLKKKPLVGHKAEVGSFKGVNHGTRSSSPLSPTRHRKSL